MKTGTLFGVSVGTGDPELITVKGLRVLQNSSLVAFPAGINHSQGVAQKIVATWLQPQQQLLPLDFPYVFDNLELQQAWQTAAAKVVGHLQSGTDITFACLGDVSFYSTFTYLAQTVQKLDPQIEVETIPGVCSPMAIASELGVPLSVNRQKIAILPALYSLTELETALDWAEVVVLLKVSSVYDRVWQILARRNLLDRSAIVEKATFPEQKIYRGLRSYPQLDLSYFSVLLVEGSTK